MITNFISEKAIIGDNVQIWHFAYIGDNTKIAEAALLSSQKGTPIYLDLK